MKEEEAANMQQGGDQNKMRKDDGSSQSLLSIVHDKNKKIEGLQKQLHFQKLQLKYYLGNTFRSSKMIEFSKSCNPLVIEENMPLTLAASHFCVQVGIKGKLSVLYERMCNVDGRIHMLLHIQECLLRKMIGKVYEIVKKEDSPALHIQVQRMLTQPEYMVMFQNLLNVHLGLRKSLDTYRICCDRLLIIEEERNSIVEQVYSLPIEQRTNCNYLIGIQIEKVQLQNRLKEILKDQSVLRKKVEQLNEIEAELKLSQEEYRKANKNCTEHMTDMLRRVNFEALGLIAKSNQQREKYTKEIVKLKCENQRIVKLLEKLKKYVQEKQMSKDSLRLDAVYSAGLYQALETEINQAIQDNEMNKYSAAQKVRSECKILSQKLQNIQKENGLLEKELEGLRTDYSEARRRWQRELETVERERNEYKSQVEDLQAIRAIYAQLVDSSANLTGDQDPRQNLKTNENANKQKELEQENLRLSKVVAELKDETNKQKSKIRRLTGIIFNLDGKNQKEVEIEDLETKDVGSGDIGNVSDTLLPKTNSCIVGVEKSKLEKDIILEHLQKSNVSQEDLKKLVETQQLDEYTTNMIKDLTAYANECRCDSLSCGPLDSLKNKTENRSKDSPGKSFIKIETLRFDVPDKIIKTKDSKKDAKNKDSSKKSNNSKTERKISGSPLVSVKVKYTTSNKNRLFEDLAKKTKQELTVPSNNEVVQFQAQGNSDKLPNAEKTIPLVITYRGIHNFRSKTDLVHLTESRCIETENISGIPADEIGIGTSETEG